ncbi:MAG: hypothetical protein QOJ02_4257 [Acidobacteriota bacterium]|jgi:hypothetical protein|nr:hypothetical protein [Acidobacteriota bacterium]
MESIHTDSEESGKGGLSKSNSNVPPHRLDEWVDGSGMEKLEIKAEHDIVLRALKAANLVCRRVVNNPEIAQAISEEELAQLTATYQQNTGTVIGKILTLLQARGLVFSPGKIGKNRYYCATGILAPERTVLPSEQTRRSRVMKLVRGAVTEFGRAVRIGDILSYAAGRIDARDLDPQIITHDVLSLAETEDLRVVGVVRGDEKGSNLYLPPEFDPAAYAPSVPLTWVEEVAQAFNEAWAEHVKQAGEEGRLPRPLSTGEVRARWKAMPNAHSKAVEQQPVITAMLMLAQKIRRQPPLVRKIRRKGEKAILWAPIDIPTEALDLGHAYATDTERVSTAVRRAVQHLGRPVTVRDVTDEIELDQTLRPARSQALYSILTDISKERTDMVEGARKKRATRRIYRVGMVGNETYYYHRATDIAEAEAYVELLRLESQWDTVCASEQLERIERCCLPTVAVGRAMLITVEAGDTLYALDSFLIKRMGDSTKREAEDLRNRIAIVVEEAHRCLSERGGLCLRVLPQEVSREVPSWTSHELLPILYPLYPLLKKNNSSSAQLISLLYDWIRRVPNRDHVNRFSNDPREAAEFLFDRADSLLYAAQKWGGYECRFLARTARVELGLLRDVRFVFPALQAEDVRARLVATACLAFLWSDEGKEHLRRLAVEDPEPGIRQSALWAYGFAGGTDMQELLIERSNKDMNVHVRTFAKKAMNLDEKGWWAF